MYGYGITEQRLSPYIWGAQASHYDYERIAQCALEAWMKVNAHAIHRQEQRHYDERVKVEIKRYCRK